MTRAPTRPAPQTMTWFESRFISRRRRRRPKVSSSSDSTKLWIAAESKRPTVAMLKSMKVVAKARL
jgi:hypothetical protein